MSAGIDQLTAALLYAKRGWPVFPIWPIRGGKCSCGHKGHCEHPGKHPIGKLAPKGRNSATTDQLTIVNWWKVCPDANIGIATGRESGLVVEDVDPRHGGNESKKKLEKLGNFPITPTAYTGGGGEHILMLHPGNGQKIKSSNNWRPGIDIKADGGYIVAPPSNHISGGSYSWKIPPDSTPLAKVPDWLMSQLTKDDEPKQTSGKKVEGEIPDGKRNSTLTSLAGSMRRRGMSQEAIEAALLAENAKCSPPLPDKDVLTIARSVARYEPSDETEKEKQTQQDVLLTIAAATELFHTPDEDGYGIIPINAHREIWSIRSKGFRRWLCHEFYKSQKKGPQPEAVSSALQVLEAQAQFDGPERPVWVRVAEHDGSIYLDLANEAWEAVKITSAGWEVVADPPVCFRRTRGMMSLPYPVKGGSVKELRPFLNVGSDDDFILMVAYLIGAMRPCGPYPVMVLNGEQGSAKSTAARTIGASIDPCTSPLRSSPREVRDLMIAATNSWILGFDNLSGVSDWLSDAMCRLSTGGGFSTRELYTDREEIIFEATRPIILNGIDTISHRQDLVDRCLTFNLPQIEDKARRPESQLWTEFEASRPRILGALLDAVSMALKNIDHVKLPSLPRMADFAMWVSAAESALPWPVGSFMEAYMGNRAEAVELSLEADCVAVAVREHMADKTTWTGKPSELYEKLEKMVPENTKRSKAWPKAANKLSNRLKRAATFLRAIGIDMELGGWSKTKGREIVIRRVIQSSESTVGTVGTVEDEKPCGFSSHDTKSGTVGTVESTVGNPESSHDTNGSSHDTEKEPWEGKANNHAAFHDTHDTHDTLHTLEADVEEFGI